MRDENDGNNQGKYNKELTTNSGTRIAAAYQNRSELNTGHSLFLIVFRCDSICTNGSVTKSAFLKLALLVSHTFSNSHDIIKS